MRKRLILLVAATAAASSLLFFVSPADAVSTRHFTLDDAASLSGGELEGTMVHSDGRVTVGVALARVELEGAALAYAVARDDDGTLYVATGDAGRIYRVRGDEVSTFAETGQLLVSSLAIAGDTLYAGTLPEGRIFRIPLSTGAVEELAKPEGAEHVWDLAYRDGRLYAATGPEGKVFAIDRQGRAQLFFDADETHVMSLAFDGDVLYAGTSDEAVVYRLRGPGQAEVVYDFPGNEITALDARQGLLAVAANDLPAPRTTSTKTKGRSSNSTPRPGKGRLWRVDADGRVERIFDRDDGHFTAVRIAEDERIFVGDGAEGRVFVVDQDRTSATWADVDERQVLDIDVSGERPVFVTGDGAALYRATPATPAQARWTSKVLDAEFLARWGQLTWRGDGRVTLQTRSGNGAEPDATWTEWSAPLSSPGPVRSPAARFVQVRAQLAGDAVLRAVQLYYLPQNQRPTLTSVGLKTSRSKNRHALPDPSTTYELQWSVDNPDDDPVRYRIRYKREGQRTWRELLRSDEVLTETHYRWETSGLADGWYVVQVEASDEPANPPALVLRSTRESEPIRIDNHPPRIEGLTARGRVVRGRAVDALGPIARLEVAIDGRDWLPLHPDDQLLDTASERFEVRLTDLEAGDHVVAVRATDAAGNSATGEIAVRLGAR